VIINNEIVTTWTARDAGVVASTGRISSGLLNVGRSAETGGRQVGIMNQQVRALGTTIRYALAGTAVFGITSMVRNLNQLQQQMGLISAIGGTAGVRGLTTSGGLTDFIQGLQGESLRSLTPLSDLNDAAINFLSTVQGAKKSEIPRIIGDIAEASKLSQTPVEDLTRTVTTLGVAFRMAPTQANFASTLRQWYQLISTAPGGIAAAPAIAQQLGPLASVAQFGRMSMPAMFGITLGALRFGATPSTGLRGTQYFLQSLFQPGKSQAKALAQAGFTPERLQREGGTQFVLDYLEYVKRLGGGGASVQQLKQFGNMVDQLPDTEAGLAPNQAIPGYSPQSLAFLRNTIGRIHGIRTAAVLISQLDRQGGVGSVMDDIRTMDQAQNDQIKGVQSLAAAWKRFSDKAQLQKAAIAINTMGTQVALAFAPVLNLASRGISFVGKEALRHQDATKLTAQIGGGLAAAFGISRILTGRFIPFGRLGSLGRTSVVGMETAQSLAGTQPTGTANNPFFVVVVGQIFKGPGGGGGGGVGKTLEDEAKRFGPFAAFLGRNAIRRVIGGAAAATTLFGAEAPAIPDAIRSALSSVGIGKDPMGRDLPTRQFPLLRQVIERAYKGFPDDKRGREQYDKFVKAFWDKTMSPVELEKQLRRQRARGQLMNLGISPLNFNTGRFLNNALGLGQSPFRFDAQGDLVLEIRLLDDQKKVVSKNRVHVPAGVYHGGKKPSTRGQRKTARMDFPRGRN